MYGMGMAYTVNHWGQLNRNVATSDRCNVVRHALKTPRWRFFLHQPLVQCMQLKKLELTMVEFEVIIQNKSKKSDPINNVGIIWIVSAYSIKDRPPIYVGGLLTSLLIHGESCSGQVKKQASRAQSIPQCTTGIFNLSRCQLCNLIGIQMFIGWLS